MKLKQIALFSTAIISIAASPALAGMSANATTELNFRSGPGSQYEIQGVIPADAEVDVVGCLDNGEWCEVNFDGQEGWAYSAYLTTPVENEPVVLYQAPKTVEIETVTYDEGNKAAGGAAGATIGAAAGALLIGGPAALAAGAIIGAATGASSAVDETTVTYVRENPVEPVYLSGEVAVGAGIPDSVQVYEVPEQQYSYVNVNGQTVVVDSDSRRIVRVIR
ncbi:DUF1236 domain-containing protein [Puniceibacterium sediminis]|uniref:Uncharacterized conserved protein YraI n=1 Tax=Puniceibacterium sediminis TaxID=1608407 RepID=A0A238XIX4_9RHOB|nr:DUF1236 domain-containing protein [Puniceibacterium sediminis]SNR58877.1 Uncharacterized conserved protein YraI [Puniceibacterium sediminis]